MPTHGRVQAGIKFSDWRRAARRRDFVGHLGERRRLKPTTIVGINIQVIGGVESDAHNRIDSAVGLTTRTIEPVFEVIIVARKSNRAVTKAKHS